MSERIDGISLRGFSDPITVETLWQTRCAAVPADCGIYLIIRPLENRPHFLLESTGGRFKGRDPTYTLDVVQNMWIDSAHVVYIGKAAGRQGLKRRVYDLLAFGYGQPVGHWGGRLLWHLPDRAKMLARWRACSAEASDSAETAAIASFKKAHAGKRPFANLRK